MKKSNTENRVQNTSYGSNSYKRSGIINEALVMDKILRFVRNQKFNVIKVEKASKQKDMNLKYDYSITFDASTPFGKYLDVKIDIKYGKTLTLVDQLGRNTLQNSQSTFLVFNFPKNPLDLLWINTNKLKECLEKYPPVLKNSFETGNKSKFFYIEDYVEKYKEFLGNSCKYVAIEN